MEQTASESFIVPLSRVKIALLLLGSAAIVACAVWLWTIAEHQDRYDPWSLKAVCALGIGFFGLCGLYAFKKLVDRTPGLIVDSVGILDNSSGLSVGRIPWAEVRSIRVCTVRGRRLLNVEVEEPAKYVNQGNLFRRRIRAANLKYFGSPIQISAVALRVDFDELADTIARFYDRYLAEVSQSSESSR